MATKPTISTIAAGSKYSTTDLNTIFGQLQDAFEGVLGLDGQDESPNTITQNVDWGGYKLRNLGAGTASTDAARLQDITDAADLDSGLITLRTELGSTSENEGASLIGIWDTDGYYTATDVEAALKEAAEGINSHEADTETHGTTGDIVGEDNVQTLTNKTLTSPTITNPTITGLFIPAISYKDNTDNAVVNTGAETDMVTYTLPANSLSATGGLRIKGAFTATGNAAPHEVLIYFGATNVVTLPVQTFSNSHSGQYEVVIYNTTTSAQRAVGSITDTDDTITSNSDGGGNYGTAAIDTTADVIIKVAIDMGTGVDTFTNTMFVVEHFDA